MGIFSDEETKPRVGSHRQDPVSLLLRFVAVDGQSRPSVLPEAAGDEVAALLGLTEYQDAAAVHFPLQQAYQAVVLAIL